MFDLIEYVHKVSRIESTVGFAFLVAGLFAVIGGFGGWLVDGAYKNSPEYKQAHPPFTSVNFALIPEKFDHNLAIDHVPRLDLTVRNRGSDEIRDVRLSVSQYLVGVHTEVPVDPKAPFRSGKFVMFIDQTTRPADSEDIVIAERIRPGHASPTINLAEMKPFNFSKPPKPGEARSGPAVDKYYALRFTFFDTGTGEEYFYYRVISNDEPYILPIDDPKMRITVSRSNNFPDMVREAKQKILADQRELYQDLSGNSRQYPIP